MQLLELSSSVHLQHPWETKRSVAEIPKGEISDQSQTHDDVCFVMDHDVERHEAYQCAREDYHSLILRKRVHWARQKDPQHGVVLDQSPYYLQSPSTVSSATASILKDFPFRV